MFETLWPSHHGGYAIRICMRSLVLCLKTSFSSNEKYGKLELKNCCEQFLRSHEGARKKTLGLRVSLYLMREGDIGYIISFSVYFSNIEIDCSTGSKKGTTQLTQI